jgi:hypothetical protein
MTFRVILIIEAFGVVRNQVSAGQHLKRLRS